MKLRGERIMLTSIPVAPLAGAWIETDQQWWHDIMPYVAPLAGAWIETKKGNNGYIRGFVAPLAGAWIETLGIPG